MWRKQLTCLLKLVSYFVHVTGCFEQVQSFQIINASL